MDRAEAEAIYDSGREACVEFILGSRGAVCAARGAAERGSRPKRVRTRVRVRKPPSMDPPKSREQRRAEARAKAKELMRWEGERRKAGGQPGHRGAGRELQALRIRSMRSSITTRMRVAGAARGSLRSSGDRAAVRSPPGRRVAADQRDSGPSIARTSCAVGTAGRGPAPGCPTRIAGSRVRAAVAGGGGDVDRPATVSRAAGSSSSRAICSASTLSTGAVDAICQRASEALAGPHLQLQDWVLGPGARCMSMRPAGAPAVRVARCGPRPRPSAAFLADRRALQPRAVQRAHRHQLSGDRGL